MRKAVIMAGGTGTRLWPVSREARPKQFLAFDEHGTLLQQAYRRLQLCLPDTGIYVCTLDRYANLTREQLPTLNERQLILEPCGRGTGPATAYAAAWLSHRFGDTTCATLAADSWISQPEVFAKALQAAFAAVEESPDTIAAIGIRPTRPETGFGYIELEDGAGDSTSAQAVRSFVEKPDRRNAEKYLSTGRHLWNGSFFVWQSGRLLDLFEQFEPEIARRVASMRAAGLADRPTPEEAAIYETMPRVSVDRAVMERAHPMVAIAADMGWNDMGSWQRVAECCGYGNTGTGARVSVHDGRVLVRGCGRLIATLGIDGIAVIDTPDALLVCNLEQSEALKEVMDAVRAEGRDDLA